MKISYTEVNDAMRRRSVNIAEALVNDQGEPQEHRLDGDFCQYFTSMELAQWIRLIHRMNSDDTITKDKMTEVLDSVLHDALDNLCATKKWAGQMDVQHGGHQSQDDFVRNQKRHDS